MRRTILIAFSILTLMASAQDYGKYGLFYEQRATLFDTLPIDSADIVMLGNSLTNGCEWHELLGMPNVKNRGISGDIIDGVALRLQSIINGQPAKIFLMIGVNDVSHDLTADSIATAYGELIDSIHAQMPGTRLYVQSCLPFNSSFGRYKKLDGKDQVVRDINAQVQSMAADKGFTWIDLYPAFADEEGRLKANLTNDGLHLLGPGYALWRTCISPYINE